MDQALEGHCYQRPLKLEDGTPNTFLETTFSIADNDYTYWLKNTNVPGQPCQVWRYAHYHSYGTPKSKIGVFKATLQKIHEFRQLQSPPRVIWQVCNYMAVRTRDPTWFRIRSSCITTKSSC